MTSIFQREYCGLKVRDDCFQVLLSFRKIPATLTIPFAAMTQFVDPGVQFGLQFQGSEGPKAAPLALPGREPAPLADPKSAPETAKEPEKPSAPAEVVNLDAFRKK